MCRWSEEMRTSNQRISRIGVLSATLSVLLDNSNSPLMCTLVASNECISAFYFQFESQVILI